MELRTIVMTSIFTGNTSARVISAPASEWAAFDRGTELIQVALPSVSADDREFLMTGATPEEWDAMFFAPEPDGDDDPCDCPGCVEAQRLNEAGTPVVVALPDNCPFVEAEHDEDEEVAHVRSPFAVDCECEDCTAQRDRINAQGWKSIDTSVE